ncbi:hypothetical protein, partial [Alistipes communis]|uniref:hypothetical protein n=1 Tax=Alistipes communis TaxID=2585118 RepID=UPI003AAE8C84
LCKAVNVFFHFQLPFSLPAFRLHRAIAVSRGDVFRHSSPFRGGGTASRTQTVDMRTHGKTRSGCKYRKKYEKVDFSE